jgi:hypothetical protein
MTFDQTRCAQITPDAGVASVPIGDAGNVVDLR